MGDRLRGVEHHRNPLRVGGVDDLAHRVDGAEGVRDVGHRHEARARSQHREVGVEIEHPVVVDRHHPELRPGLLAKELPRDDVRMVLHVGDDDLVALSEPWAHEAVRDEVDGLGGAARKDDLARIPGVEKAPDLLPGALVGRRRAFAQGVHAAVDIGVVVLVVVAERVDDRARLLAGRAVVEIGEGVAIDLLVERRKVGPNCLDVERGAGIVRPGCGAHDPWSLGGVIPSAVGVRMVDHRSRSQATAASSSAPSIAGSSARAGRAPTSPRSTCRRMAGSPIRASTSSAKPKVRRARAASSPSPRERT